VAFKEKNLGSVRSNVAGFIHLKWVVQFVCQQLSVISNTMDDVKVRTICGVFILSMVSSRICRDNCVLVIFQKGG